MMNVNAKELLDSIYLKLRLNVFQTEKQDFYDKAIADILGALK